MKLRSETPKVGDVVASSYSTIPARKVTALHPNDLEYEVITATGTTIRRRPLYSTWRSWCRAHRAEIIETQ